ncbi:hypothetical protein IMG5_075240 [Ichthyophthirius multifiliis]|uniref:Uncharacterized protein n=1 Tax=Ichthyophthirius multifiliis TaxID=5932 RepID=G0QQ45_ICHMU|nr:hypothetical protein IMG5_075240 [Ichthyophthirius multifiliis]EGR32659.1 hypothetical protein IMG5_075240 [Ichthyophthirius multifiliis]|eukprot:XP_004036645.1 hypothetical protein IMG5_075240 [Ichthyophthirius multifiliis]
MYPQKILENPLQKLPDIPTVVKNLSEYYSYSPQDLKFITIIAPYEAYRHTNRQDMYINLVFKPSFTYKHSFISLSLSNNVSLWSYRASSLSYFVGLSRSREPRRVPVKYMMPKMRKVLGKLSQTSYGQQLSEPFGSFQAYILSGFTKKYTSYIKIIEPKPKPAEIIPLIIPFLLTKQTQQTLKGNIYNKPVEIPKKKPQKSIKRIKLDKKQELKNTESPKIKPKKILNSLKPIYQANFKPNKDPILINKIINGKTQLTVFLEYK